MEANSTVKTNNQDVRKPKIPYPLPDEYRLMIAKELGKYDNYESLLTIIEEVASNPETNIFEGFVERLTKEMGNDARPFCSRLFMFRRRPCKLGVYCRRKDHCIYAHDNLPREGIRRMKSTREVVINKIPADLYNDEAVGSYCARFGEVDELRKIKPGRYLITFAKSANAKDMVASQEPVLGHPDVTKFFNRAFKSDGDELIHLMNEQKVIIDELLKDSNVPEGALNRLSGIAKKMQRIIIKCGDELFSARKASQND
ncbi:hypothetical protein TCON_1605 [Astathelohania contejeani]|uniref:C3H1-type domain-containing protein n=1 Tax=Astathelohania contejeani TaxID=164912 RepID=A0ABQ7HYE5_9MICR|nr:hypothetical protein TCON_1605 [Thelohania contejeani]